MTAQAPPKGKVQARVDALLVDYDARGTWLQFIENADGSKVHVVAPAGEACTPEAYGLAPALGGADVVDWALGVTRTVCGVRVAVNRGGVEAGGRPTAAFRDDALCGACHKAFGDRSVVIFECNPSSEAE